MNAKVNELSWDCRFYDSSWKTKKQRELMENAIKEKRDVSYQ